MVRSSRLRVIDVELEHETIELRLGQRIGAFLFDWVLSGEDEERFGEAEGLFADGDLLFLHRFEQARSALCRRAIDFVGKNEIGEDRSFGGEAASAWIVNQRSDHICGQ